MYTKALFYVAFLAIDNVQAAPAARAKCINTFPSLKPEGGLLTTNPFSKSVTGENPMPYPYYFNKEGFLAFDPTGASHRPIKAFFQACTPNYAQNPNDQQSQPQLYGRFYIPSMNRCLSVTNPSGKAPYYVSTAPCPSAANMGTKASIPFNFMAATEDDVDMRWVGSTVPDKKKWQSGCSNHYGQLFVNATNLQYGYNIGWPGQPNTIAGGNEDYRIHLYCPNNTGTNNFVVPT